MTTGVGIVLLGLVSMFVAWLVLGGQEKAGKWGKFVFWLTLCTIVEEQVLGGSGVRVAAAT